MNPLCCIAPVSVERGERAAAPVVSVKASARPSGGFENAARHGPTQVPTATGNLELGTSCEAEEGASRVIEGRDGQSGGGGGNGMVAGILYKWVNYGKGWKSRWFVLQDGVLSYYKVHGPDKISVGLASEAVGVRVIGDDSFRRVRRAQRAGDVTGHGDVKQWRPFGEIHLKVGP